MWTVEQLIAVDDKGNFVTLVNKKLVLQVLKGTTFKVSRVVDVKETPPCLSIAVDDLLRQVTQNDRTRGDKATH